MDQAITIRTLVFHGDEYSYQAGAGIVAESVPAAEHDEVGTPGGSGGGGDARRVRGAGGRTAGPVGRHGIP